MSHLELLPAVDISGGQAVQLVQGVAGSEKRFGDPVEAALRWQEAGAEWIHLVDLDAAFGRGHNRDLLASIVGTLDIDVEMSGGIRDDESLEAAMQAGCRRVNIGTAALEQPEWCAAAIASHGDRIAIGLDVRGQTLAARGWTRDGGDLYDVLARLDSEGCARYVVTDVNKDGMLQGPNLQLLRDVCARTDRPVVASGGITELADLSALMGLVPDGVEGAIIGTALYEGRFTLEEASRPHPRRSHEPRRPRHPVPRRRRRPRGQGRELPAAARRGRPRRARQAVRRRGGRRADLPRHLRLARGPGDDDGDRQRDRRAGVHPAHRRAAASAASRTSTGCCEPARTRWRSTPRPSGVPSWSRRSPTGSATRCWCSRSMPAAHQAPTPASR